MEEKNKELKVATVRGGVGQKLSNDGTQWYLQNRIYEGDIAIAICTCCNPYYVVYERKKTDK